jgi:SAM-dependent methyltransferase
MNTSLYTSDTYRESMDENVTLPDFYQKHDAEILDKLKYTGTSIYRDKRFMDIGCGGGGYADFVRGVASQVVLVEPNENFTALLRDKDYEVFSYAEDAIDKYKSTIDLITSYDVIEHVDDPKEFLQTIYRLLRENGKAFIGTPTEYPVLRNLLGAEFDAFVFSVQHPWVFSSRSLELLAKKCGFSTFKVKFYQRFGIGNLVAWLQLHKSCGEAVYDFITPALNSLYKIEMAREETAEYLILELGK